MLVILAAVAVAMASIWAAAAVPAIMGAPSAYLVGNFGDTLFADGDLGLVIDLGEQFSPVGEDTEHPCNSGGLDGAKGLGTPPSFVSTELGLDTMAAAVSDGSYDVLCNAKTAAAVPDMMGTLC